LSGESHDNHLTGKRSADENLFATIWLADIGGSDDMNAVWDAWVDPDNPPARACVESKLISDWFLVEVMVVAALD